MFPFYTPWKHPKTFSFLVFSGDIKWEHWSEMGSQPANIGPQDVPLKRPEDVR